MNRKPQSEYFSDIKYLSHTVNKIPGWKKFNIKKHKYYIANKNEFHNLQEKYHLKIKNNKTAPVEIRECRYGLGLFTKETIRSGTLIGEYTGYLQHGNGDEYSWDYPEIPGFPELEISALKAGNEMRFINHNYKPNCIAEHFPVDGMYIIIIISSKYIKQGQQLFLDYGDEYWLDDNRELIIEY